MIVDFSGLVNTKISDGMISWKRMIFTTAGWFLGKDCKMGAQCTDYLATETLPKNEINEGNKGKDNGRSQLLLSPTLGLSEY